jgi:hypothetical protein
LPIGVSVGVGAAAAAAALALGGASEASHHTTTEARPLKASRPLTPAQNRRPLGPRTLGQLSAWAERLGSCLSDHGLGLGRPEAGDDQVAIHVPAALAKDPMALVTQIGSCTKSLGGPPPRSAVVLRRGGGAIQIFEPKTCPLRTKPAP